MVTKRLPLEGITVVSIEQAVAAPFATRQLADLGARVIKIERAEGDFARNYDTKVHGMSSYFVWLNRSKESVVLDLKNDHDLSILKNIISKADVFVQNLAPGAVKKYGLDAEGLREKQTTLIHASISGYGQGGPMEKSKAYDLLIQCESGLMSLTGSSEEIAKVGVSIADIAAGMYAYTGILTALINRMQTGEGDTIEISMLEALAEWVQQPELYARYGGASPLRSGASHASIAPYGPFEATDGSVYLAVQNEREWARFCSIVLESEEMLTDSRFSSNSARVQNKLELRRLIGEKFHTLSVEEVEARLQKADIAFAKLNDVKNTREHPQLAARGRWIEVASPVGDLEMLRPPVTSESVGSYLGSVPRLGQDTDKILNEFKLT